MFSPDKVHEKRQISTVDLFDSLEAAKREMKCEAPGCTRYGRERLQVHHIVPVRIRMWHQPENLAVLCMDHHALVERFYWHRMSELAPDTARDLRRIARKFRARAIPYSQVYQYKDETEYLWRLMNAKTADPKWWQLIYTEALDWASQQQTIRSVHPGDAMVELSPWWVPKSSIVVA